MPFQKSITVNPTYIKAIAFSFAFSIASAASAQTAKSEEAPVTQAAAPQTIKIKVSGITCSGDIKDIQKAVSELQGVTQCKQVGRQSPTSVFEVSFHPSLVSEAAIRKAVEATPGCEDPADRPYKVKKG